MKKIKYIILTILVILLIPGICIVAPVILFVYSCDWSPYTEITRIDVGNGRIISIYGASCWEVSRGVYYEAHEGGKVIVPRTLWDFDNGFEKYNSLTFVSAENQSLVGVFGPKPDKDYLMIIVDFKSGDSWPRSIDNYEIAIKKKFNFLKRLQKENPSIIIPTLPSQAPKNRPRSYLSCSTYYLLHTEVTIYRQLIFDDCLNQKSNEGRIG